MIVLPLGGCLRGCTSSRPPIHVVPNMDHQEKYRAQAESPFFFDGATMRPPVEGTVARGELFEDVAVVTGKDDSGAWAANPLAVDAALLSRGGERFGIYCAPCHGAGGDGQGVMKQYLPVAARDLREQRLVEMADGEIFDTVTNGFGTMQGYRYPIPARDRWAIIAYLRQLQQGGGS